MRSTIAILVSFIGVLSIFADDTKTDSTDFSNDWANLASIIGDELKDGMAIYRARASHLVGGGPPWVVTITVTAPPDAGERATAKASLLYWKTDPISGKGRRIAKEKQLSLKELSNFLKAVRSLRVFELTDDNDSFGPVEDRLLVEDSVDGTYVELERASSVPHYNGHSKIGRVITDDKDVFALAAEAFLGTVNELKPTGTEQADARQPTTAPDSKSEGDEKPKPESEGRSQ